MEHRFDTLAKAMAGSISRREALSRLGGGAAGLLLACLGIGRAWSDPATNSQCEDFCRSTCGISSGGDNGFGKCVSSCEACVSSTGGSPCGCPASPGAAVACCTGGQVCSAGTCCLPSGAPLPFEGCGCNYGLCCSGTCAADCEHSVAYCTSF